MVKELLATPLDGFKPTEDVYCALALPANASSSNVPATAPKNSRTTNRIGTSSPVCARCSIPDQSDNASRGCPMGRVIAAGVSLGLCAVLVGAPPASADSGSLGLQVSIDSRPI